jgi:3-hydroxyisobutyrate dehydrogenase-like beta-hydroxyacid dehydrogenase
MEPKFRVCIESVFATPSASAAEKFYSDAMFRRRPRVGFIGLGAMGSRMALRLASAGFDVAVYNRTRRKVAVVGRASSHRLRVAQSPREAAEGAAFVVTMISDATALEAVARGPDGLVGGLGRGATWIEMSTVGRPVILRMSALARERGAWLVDAPVSGTLGPAERGELVAFVGGPVKRALPVLRALCKRVVPVGRVGQGQALKVVVNGLGAHHLVAFATMLALGERAGLARRDIVLAFTTGAFASPSYVGKKAKVLSRSYAPEFSLRLTQKDARLAEALQREVGLDLPVLRAAAREIARGVEAGLGERDLFALETLYAK